MTAAIAAGAGEPRTISLDVFEDRQIQWWEYAMVSTWFLVTYVEIPMASPIRYLTILAIFGYGALHWQRVAPVLLKCWPILLLPVFGAFSFIWADYSSAAMRQGILYLLAPTVIIILGATLSLRMILQCYFIASFLALLWLLQWWGLFFSNSTPFGSKNNLGLHMTFCMFFSLIRAMDEQERGLIRLFALLVVPLAFYIVLASNSATSLVFAVVGAAGLILVKFVWMGISRMPHMRSLILLLAIVSGLTVTIVVLSMPTNSIIADFLGVLGKDTTLTGRTDIWNSGKLVAEQRPVLGVGLGSFWQDAVGMAQTINENDHKPIGTKLTFHNAYLEVRVHLGYVGMALFVLLVSWCTWRAAMQWMRRPSLEVSGMLVISLISVISTFTESWLWIPFTTVANLFYLGAVTSLSEAGRRYIGRVSAEVSETATPKQKSRGVSHAPA